MAVDLAGIFGDPIDSMQNLIANSESFQTFTESEDAVTAKSSIYEIFKKDTDGVTFPLVLITYEQGDWSLNRDAEGSGIKSFKANSNITVLFEDQIDEISQDNIKTFLNSISSVMNDILNLSGTSDYLMIQGVSLGGFYYDDEPETPILGIHFNFTWGM